MKRKEMPETGGKIIVLLAMLLTWGCAGISPESNIHVEYLHQRKNDPGFMSSKRPTVYVQKHVTLGNEPDGALTSLLEAMLYKNLEEMNYSVSRSREDADYVLSCTMRGSWDHGGSSALVSFVTLSVYTPIWYPWIIEVNIYNARGEQVADAYERGYVRWDCFGVLAVPTTVVQGLLAVPESWRNLAKVASETAMGKLASLEASNRG